MEKEELYLQAAELCGRTMVTANIIKAKELLEQLGDYKDSADLLKKCDRYLEFAPGSVVEFGSYQGKPIRWIVLGELARNRLLFAEKPIDNLPWHNVRDYTNWSNCSLRRWLNKEFLEQGFTLQERMSVLLTPCENRDERWSVENGPATKDKVFVFNSAELDQYLPTEEARCCGEWWWMRGHGDGLLSIHAVYTDGSKYLPGVNKNSLEIGVRPTMWVRL